MTQERTEATAKSARYDVVVVGGGAAGLNAALMLARARRSVLVLDAGEPRNAPAGAVHGLLAREAAPPGELLARGRQEVREYGGEIAAARVDDVSRVEAGEFTVTTSDGQSVGARRVLVTTGLVDELPDVPGVREQWGHDVVHCPYCHGWEVRDRAIGVFGGGPMSVHQALLFRQWSDDVVFFTRAAALSDDDRERLVARGIGIVEGEVAAVAVDGDRITGVRSADGTTTAREVVVVGPRMTVRAGFLAGVGLYPSEHPSGAGDHLVVDGRGETEVTGVWAAGNVTDPSAQVGGAAAAGAFTAAQLNGDLVQEETRLAVADYRASPVATAG